MLINRESDAGFWSVKGVHDKKAAQELEIISVSRNITERKQVEEALQRAHHNRVR